MAVESRLERRVGVLQTATVVIEPTPDRTEALSTSVEVLDRSRRGLRFQTGERFVIGEMGQIRFAGDGKNSLSRQFDVRWVKPLDSGGFEVGVRLYLSRNRRGAAA